MHSGGEKYATRAIEGGLKETAEILNPPLGCRTQGCVVPQVGDAVSLWWYNTCQVERGRLQTWTCQGGSRAGGWRAIWCWVSSPEFSWLFSMQSPRTGVSWGYLDPSSPFHYCHSYRRCNQSCGIGSSWRSCAHLPPICTRTQNLSMSMSSYQRRDRFWESVRPAHRVLSYWSREAHGQPGMTFQSRYGRV